MFRADPARSAAMTHRHQLETTLRTLKLSGMLDTLEARLAQATAGEFGHLEFLQVLCEDEITRRDAASLARRVRQARFEHAATLEEFDFAYNPKIPAANIRDLAALRNSRPSHRRRSEAPRPIRDADQRRSCRKETPLPETVFALLAAFGASAEYDVRSVSATPSSNVQAENHERLRIGDACCDRLLERLELVQDNKAAGDQAVTQILEESDEKRTPSVSGRVNVHDRIDLDVNQSSLTQKTRKLAANVEVDSVRPRVSIEEFDGA
jgi:hypothetical protein